MSEKRKVTCPRGHEMHPFEKTRRVARNTAPSTATIFPNTENEETEYAVYYRCDCGWESPKCITHHENGLDGARKEAYRLATLRPPNLPLTREQVEAMPDLAAVWVFVEERYKPTIITAEHAMLRYQGDTVLPFHSDAMLFAAPPTPADIEAARNAE